jgi:glycosyltransferase involved in cell wall biosynthesis
MLISILIPVYNESAAVIELLSKVNAQHIEGITFEIIIIDDGSTDDTLEILHQHSDLYTKILELSTNRGKGAAIKEGLAASKGEYILFQDADLEYDPSDYGALFYPVLNYSADIVMGSRLTAPQYTRVHYYWHKIGNRLITFVFNILNNTTFTDIYSCYLVIRRSLIVTEQLQSEGWEQQAEILSKVVRRGKVFYEVPISYHGRTYEDGKKIKAYHAIAVLLMIIKSRLFFH